MSTSDTFSALHKTKGIEILIESLTHNISRLDDEIDKVETAMNEISNFLNMDYEETEQESGIKIHAKHPVIYQYAKENQEDFNKNAIVLESEIEAFYPLIISLYRDLGTPRPPLLPAQQTGGNGTNITLNPTPQKQGNSFFDLFRKKENGKISEVNPLEQSSDLIHETKQIPGHIKNFVSYHAHGFSRSNRLHRGNWEAQQSWLANEQLLFEARVKPSIVPVIIAGKKIRVELEQRQNALVASRAIEEYNREQANSFNKPV